MKQPYYKYRPLYKYGWGGEAEPHPFTKSILEQATLFYSAPKDFNDPFDCNLKLHINDSSDEDWDCYLRKLALNQPAHASNIEKFRLGKLWKVDPGQFTNVGEATHSLYQNSAVLCLAKTGNSIPMFSYYADNHRGISIEFQFADDEVPCGIMCGDLKSGAIPYEGKIDMGDVSYPKNFPELNYHRLYGREQLIQSLIYTKYHEWSHEKEFRILRKRTSASSVPFDKTLLTRVIFGANTKPSDIEMVKLWLKDWDSQIILSRAELRPDLFELKVNDFEILNKK